GGDTCGSPLHRLRSPLHGSFQASSPLSGSSPFARTGEFSFDTSTVRRSLEQEEQPSSPLIRYRPLTNTSSQEALGSTPTSSCIQFFLVLLTDLFIIHRVTLRRASSGKSRKEKGGNRLSMGSR
ncbi:hypothetical protein JD844_001895, partial [Phrynosoma platyrhinos]